MINEQAQQLGERTGMGLQPTTEIWAAIHTPFAADLSLDLEGLRHNVRRYLTLGLSGVFCNGLIGEQWSLTTAERKRVIETVLDEGGGRLAVSVVISGGSIEETLDLGAHAKSAGARHAVLMVPVSGPRSMQQQLAYLEFVSSRLDMPIVLFNAATATGSPLTPETFSALCAAPQLTLLKSTAYGENHALRAAARGGVVVSDPLEEHYLANRQQYGQAILYADPEPYLYQRPGDCPIASYISDLDRGDLDAARRKFESLNPLRKVFNKWVMGPLIAGHMPNAAVKHWVHLLGLVGGHVRAPISPLSDRERGELEDELSEAMRAVASAPQ